MMIFLFTGLLGKVWGHLMSAFSELACELKVSIGEKKTEGPIRSLKLLVVELDTVVQTFRLPLAKLVDLQSTILEFLQKCKTTLPELQELVGHLNFVCRS